MVGIVYILRLIDIADVILEDFCSRLVAEGIDTCTIVHVFGISANGIMVHLIVVHTADIGIPPPAKGDSGVGDLLYPIVTDCGTGHIAGRNSMRTPVLSTYVSDDVVFNF